MKVTVPDYYEKFRCTADKCSDNCCTAGWEIDIDDTTYESYMKENGEFGKRLKDGITVSEDNSRCFKLTKEKNCVFLNKDNLCDIIINLGEKSLCEICESHPRFHNCFGESRETGVGLCCIEAAKMILSNPEKTTFITFDENEKSYENSFDEELFDYLKALRGEIFSLSQNRDEDILKRFQNVLLFAETAQEKVDNGEFIPIDFIKSNSTKKPDFKQYSAIINSLEPLDDDWTKLSEKLLNDENSHKRALEIISKNQTAFEQLFVYFIFRHFINAIFDGDILSRTKFAVFCCLCVAWVTEETSVDKKPDLSVIIENACLISKEIEYSTENVDLILDLSWTEECLSTGEIIGALNGN